MFTHLGINLILGNWINQEPAISANNLLPHKCGDFWQPSSFRTVAFPYTQIGQLGTQWEEITRIHRFVWMVWEVSRKASFNIAHPPWYSHKDQQTLWSIQSKDNLANVDLQWSRRRWDQEAIHLPCWKWNPLLPEENLLLLGSKILKVFFCQDLVVHLVSHRVLLHLLHLCRLPHLQPLSLRPPSAGPRGCVSFTRLHLEPNEPNLSYTLSKSSLRLFWNYRKDLGPRLHGHLFISVSATKKQEKHPFFFGKRMVWFVAGTLSTLLLELEVSISSPSPTKHFESIKFSFSLMTFTCMDSAHKHARLEHLAEKKNSCCQCGKQPLEQWRWNCVSFLELQGKNRSQVARP